MWPRSTTHVGDRSSLNERRRSAAAAAWYSNLILVFWGDGRTERESRRGSGRLFRKREKYVKKAGIKPFALPVLTSRMFYLGPQRARTAFTGLTVARCASAGTVPAATTSQEPACAPPAGQDHTAFWVMEATSLKQGVREALAAALHDILS